MLTFLSLHGKCFGWTEKFVVEEENVMGMNQEKSYDRNKSKQNLFKV